MRAALVVLAFAAGLLGCHSRQPGPMDSATRTASRNVFTDSTLHAELCEPVKSGEDWRKVCTPKDQGVRIPLLKKKR